MNSIRAHLRLNSIGSISSIADDSRRPTHNCAAVTTSSTLCRMAMSGKILPSIPRSQRSVARPAAPYEPVCAVFRRYLHAQKLKFTPERAVILDAVLRKEGLFEPEQVVTDLKQAGHRASRATLYRTLTHLQDAGILKQVFFDNKQSYYEVLTGGHQNDYLICVETGRVVEFNSEKLRALRDEVCRQQGFEPLSHQFHIFGVSAEAAAKRPK